MNRTLSGTLFVGHDEQAAERFLLVAVGVSASVFGLLTLGWPVWQHIGQVVGWPFVTAYLVGTLAFAGRYAYRNDGLLVTLAGTFILLLGYALFQGVTYLACLAGGVGGCPTLFEKLSFGVFLAAGSESASLTSPSGNAKQWRAATDHSR